jgi:hypothetical protein
MIPGGRARKVVKTSREKIGGALMLKTGASLHLHAFGKVQNEFKVRKLHLHQGDVGGDILKTER